MDFEISPTTGELLLNIPPDSNPPILQRSHATIEFTTTARGSSSEHERDKQYASDSSLSIENSTTIVPAAVAEVVEPPRQARDMVLNTEWAQIESIDLVNDGMGLGFGIVGGRSTGVIIKTIVPSGISDRVSRELSF